MKYDVITIGDASLDVFVRPSEMRVTNNRALVGGKAMCFELGEKIPVKDVDYDIGGSAANVAVGLSRIGLKVSIITALGQDWSAEKILDRLIDEGVDTDQIDTGEENKTNFAVILNTEDGERTILVYHGIDYQNLQIKKSLNGSWFFLAPIGENSDHVFDQIITCISERNARFAWNPGLYQIKKGASKYRHVLKNTTVLFLNREEAIKFLNFPVRPRIEEVMKKLHLLGPKVIIVTDGKNGAYAFDGSVFYRMDIVKDVKRTDATGAGDSFASGFLGKLISADFKGDFNKELICDALKYGIMNSTSVVAHIGAQKGLLDVKSLENSVTEHPRLQVEVY